MTQAALSRKYLNGWAGMPRSEILASNSFACKKNRLAARVAHAVWGVHVEGLSWVEAGRV
jgi:hypothetical protein